MGRYEKSELEVIRNIATKYNNNTSALDIGANIGNHSIAFSEWFEHVYAFEPNPRTFQLLKLNTEKIDNISIFQFGASSKEDVVLAAVPFTNVGGTSIVYDSTKYNNKNVIEINVKALDQIDEVNNIKKVGLIKIDIEGHECSAIIGAKELILKHMPIIAFEQHSKSIGGGSTDVVRLLRKFGYDNFYSLERVEMWKISNNVPWLLRYPLRVLEAVVFGPPSPIMKLEEVIRIEPRFHSMLLASPFELEYDSTQVIE